MAGLGDLGNSNVPLVTLDACNFIPEYFHSSSGEKHWDIIYVTRAVYFKRVDVFFDTIKTIYQKGLRPKVLLVCCIPPEDATPKDVVDEYMKKFTQEERKYFTFLPLSHDYPFCLDPSTIAYFYRSSKIFVHFANDERRCRVVANAAATQMPIVCMSDPASIIPPELRHPPYCYQVINNEDFVNQIILALKEYNENADLSAIAKHFSVTHTSIEIKKQLEKFLNTTTINFNNKSFNFNNLDIRLGRHHGISYGPNKVDMSINDFICFINSENIVKNWSCNSQDFEQEISKK
jgi:glycosyltransferase involved in cell wall biosynthesis